MTDEQALNTLKGAKTSFGRRNGKTIFQSIIFEAEMHAINALEEKVKGAPENNQTFTVFIYSEDDMYSGGGYTECDNCKHRFSNAGFPMIHDAKYCPDCGAKVLKEEKND